MTTGYREFEDFAAAFPGDGGYGSAGSVERGLQEVTDNVQHFCNNVLTLERRYRLVNTGQDSTSLRQEIIQMVADTAQLAKIADSSIKKLKQQSRRLSQGDRLQLDRLVNTFSSSGRNFQRLQQSTAELEQEMLTRARTASTSRADTSSIGSYPETEREEAFLLRRDSADERFQAQKYAELEGEAALVEEREGAIRQLEHDILDINEIFRDLGTLVHEQGELVDHIEANVETAAIQVEQGNKQLVKAVKHKKCSRKLTVCIVCVLITVLVIIIIVVLVLLRVFNVIGGGGGGGNNNG